jgi:anti-sigma28 factor (negative regulator of flagellin synthesis)
MDMNHVEGLGAPRNSMPIESRKASRASAPQTPPRAASDSVEFSDDARKLAAGALGADAGAAGQPSSEERVAAARQKLLSGQLSGPAVYDKTAANLLRSGDLDQVQENADDPSAGA